jgi:hypothetical protein
MAIFFWREYFNMSELFINFANSFERPPVLKDHI